MRQSAAVGRTVEEFVRLTFPSPLFDTPLVHDSITHEPFERHRGVRRIRQFNSLSCSPRAVSSF